MSLRTIGVRTSVEKVDKYLLEENDRIANELRERLGKRGIKAIELLGGPGSGKTSLVERISERLDKRTIAYIGGDPATSLDTERIRALGIKGIQINTGGICHLEAVHINRALDELDLGGIRLLFIENVGNLICPFEFDVGSHVRVMVVSSSEGDDKFLKHPTSVMMSDVIVINKIDIAPYVGVDLERMRKDARNVNPRAPVVLTSARTGKGIEELMAALGLA